MKLFDRPSSVIAVRELLAGQGGIAGHQIEYANRSICVCQDVLGQQHRKIQALERDQTEFVGLQIECRNLRNVPCAFVGFGEGNRPIRFDRTHNMFASCGPNQRHILF